MIEDERWSTEPLRSSTLIKMASSNRVWSGSTPRPDIDVLNGDKTEDRAERVPGHLRCWGYCGRQSNKASSRAMSVSIR